jgi:hypothetical protein
MKTTIMITGQIMSVSTLKSAIQTNDCEVKKFFNDYKLIFNTKKEAVKALSDAYQHLRSDKEDWEASCPNYRRGMSLSYDAGRAYICDRAY